MEFIELLEMNVGEFGAPATEEMLRDAEDKLSPFVLTSEIVQLFKAFNGWNVDAGEIGFYSLEEAIECRGRYFELFTPKFYSSYFPGALFPIFKTGNIDYFAVLAKERADESCIVSFCMADGDREFFLEYEGVRLMISTFNSEGSQLELNPNAYVTNQKGRFSLQGVQNVFDAENLPQEWFSATGRQSL